MRTRGIGWSGCPHAGHGHAERAPGPPHGHRVHVDAYVSTAPLRHTNATGLVADGVDVKTAQTRLGHSDPRLTLAIYAQAVTDADCAAADKLGARFMPPCGMDVGSATRSASTPHAKTPLTRAFTGWR